MKCKRDVPITASENPKKGFYKTLEFHFLMYISLLKLEKTCPLKSKASNFWTTASLFELVWIGIKLVDLGIQDKISI